MVVNHQRNDSRERYQELKENVQGELPVYQQEIDQPDVWNLLQGQKDDFFIYDRCGQQTFHLELPFTILSEIYVENAIKQTYCKEICTNCSLAELPSACSSRNATEPKETGGDSHRGKHGGSHWSHGRKHPHNSHKKAATGSLPQNRTQHIQLEQGGHGHHHKQHKHLESSQSREEGGHDSATTGEPHQQSGL